MYLVDEAVSADQHLDPHVQGDGLTSGRNRGKGGVQRVTVRRACVGTAAVQDQRQEALGAWGGTKALGVCIVRAAKVV